MSWKMIVTRRTQSSKRRRDAVTVHIERVWNMNRHNRWEHLISCGTQCPWVQNYLRHFW